MYEVFPYLGKRCIDAKSSHMWEEFPYMWAEAADAEAKLSANELHCTALATELEDVKTKFAILQAGFSPKAKAPKRHPHPYIGSLTISVQSSHIWDVSP